jgi:RNA polymerase sigma-70 factor (ECF subfamily)
MASSTESPRASQRLLQTELDDMAGSDNRVTQLLLEWNSGDKDVIEQLTPLVYAELRRVAESYLRKERAGHTLQPTALVHEAYLRLVAQSLPDWNSRSHFYGVAAHLMRQVLVDHARHHGAMKRHGGLRVTLSDADVATPDPNWDVFALENALSDLERVDPRKTKIVELRYFGGLSVEETAKAAGVSVATVHRELRMAETWLYSRLKPQQG